MLDTNVLIFYARGQATGTWLRERYHLEAPRGVLMTSRVVLAETRVFMDRKSAQGQPWNDQKIKALNAILDRLHIIEITDTGIEQAYRNLVVFSEITTKPARQMEGNDLWLAAAAQITGAVLVTCDKDFDHLHQHQITVEKYDPRQPAQGSP